MRERNEHECVYIYRIRGFRIKSCGLSCRFRHTDGQATIYIIYTKICIYICIYIYICIWLERCTGGFKLKGFLGGLFQGLVVRLGGIG